MMHLPWLVINIRINDWLGLVVEVAFLTQRFSTHTRLQETSLRIVSSDTARGQKASNFMHIGGIYHGGRWSFRELWECFKEIQSAICKKFQLRAEQEIVPFNGVMEN